MHFAITNEKKCVLHNDVCLLHVFFGGSTNANEKESHEIQFYLVTSVFLIKLTKFFFAFLIVENTS